MKARPGKGICEHAAWHVVHRAAKAIFDTGCAQSGKNAEISTGWKDTPCKLTLERRGGERQGGGRKVLDRTKGSFLWLRVRGVKRSLRMSCVCVLQKISIMSSPPGHLQRSPQDSVESGDCFQHHNQTYHCHWRLKLENTFLLWSILVP